MRAFQHAAYRLESLGDFLAALDWDQLSKVWGKRSFADPGHVDHRLPFRDTDREDDYVDSIFADRIEKAAGGSDAAAIVLSVSADDDPLGFARVPPVRVKLQCAMNGIPKRGGSIRPRHSFDSMD